LSSFLDIYFQSQKTAELLLDLKVNSIIYSPQVASVDTATAICEVTVI
jgi:probable phosphoglycerate mutase